MIDLKKWEIVLCDSKLQINRNTTVQDIKDKIPDLIVRINDVKTGYVWYWCWVDIDDGEFIKAFLCFYKDDPLCRIDLLPQSKREYGWREEGIYHDYPKETLIVRKWLLDHGMTEEEIEWRKTKMFIEGSNDYRASIILTYRRY